MWCLGRKCHFHSMEIKADDIGSPTDMRQIFHVTINPETGRLEGLPKNLSKLWDKLDQPNQLNEAPEVAPKTTKFYASEKGKTTEEPSSASDEMEKQNKKDQKSNCITHYQK